MSVENYIKNNVKRSGNKIYVVPEIPEKKLNNAISVMAPELEPEYALAIIDSTVFGSAKEGFLLTGEALYKKYAFSERQKYNFADIVSAEYKLEKVVKDNGKIEEKKYVFLNMVNGSVVDLFSTYMLNVDYEKFVEFINGIIEEGGEEKNYESTSQMIPLSAMDEKIKEAYLKIICNFTYSDDEEIDSKEYAEIISLIVRIDYNKENRLKIRSYMCDPSEIEATEDLIQYINENVPEGSLEVIKKSLIKDVLYIYKAKDNIDLWEENKFIVELKDKFEIEDSHIELIISAIKNDEEILAMRKNDSEIKKSMKELVAKAAAVGVPLAAIYFSGSVVGMSAAGITSALASLGFGGVLGLSGMVTGVGVAVLIGVGAYKGIKKVTGIGELENNKQREMMLQAIIKNSQKTLDYLIEDVNEISRLLMEEIRNGLETKKKIEKLSTLLSMMSKGAKETSTRINYAEVESVIARLPKKLDIMRLEELTNEATKQKFKTYILACYKEFKLDNDESEEVRREFRLNEELTLNQFEELYSVFEFIGYNNVTDAALASIKGAGKNLIKNLLG